MSAGTTRIRLAAGHELPLLQAIEVTAGTRFADIGMDEVADSEPPSTGTLASYQRAGRAWVQVTEEDQPVAYLIADVVDDAVHIEQVSVDPAYAGRGLGRALIDHVAHWAAARGVGALTLTTFTEVPWNGPYYERCGFRVLADHEVTAGLRAIRAEEAAHGLDRWPRVAMRRVL